MEELISLHDTSMLPPVEFYSIYNIKIDLPLYLVSLVIQGESLTEKKHGD